MDGLINLNKPKGLTSRRALDVVARLARPAKAGHAGTLDPLATGVLVVGVGAGTRLVEYVQRMTKRYEAAFLLGRRSPSDDTETDVVELPDAPGPSSEAIAAVLPALTGDVLQRPSTYSAVKVDGRRAYDLARAGRNVDLSPRPVRIDAIEVLDYDYPTLRLRIACGSGVYVRAIGRDLAERLGTGAVMSELTRTAIGPFRINEAVSPNDLTADNWHGYLQALIRAVEEVPQVTLDDAQLRAVLAGQEVRFRVPGSGFEEDAAELAAVDAAGRLMSILSRTASGRWRAAKNFAR